MKPLISVVIPVFNRTWELERALDSLVRQSYSNFEVLVCDDGSTEDIESIFKRYKSSLNIRYYKIKNFGGPARARNVGINNAIGEWIAFLDSDDWWVSERFDMLLKYLNQEFDLVYHQLEVVSSGYLKRLGERRKYVGSELKYDPLKHMALLGNPIPNSSVIVRKSSLVEIGGISEDPELISVEDFDTWLMLAKRNLRMIFVPRPLGYYWLGNDGISSVSEKTIMAYRKVFNKHVNDFKDEYSQQAKSCQHYFIGSLILKVRKKLDLAQRELLMANDLPFFKMRMYRVIKILQISLIRTLSHYAKNK